MPGVTLANAAAPLVVAIDAGSSSVRAIAYDAAGAVIDGSERQIEHELETTPDGGSMADADRLFDLITQCLDHVNASVAARAGEIGAVGFSAFWHSLLGLDEDRRPVTPVLMWADKRAGPWARHLQRELDQAAVHARTGCGLHSSYWPAKLAWLRATDPTRFGRIRHWASFADYVSSRLHGALATSFSTASGTGLLDIHALTWDDALLAHLEVDRRSLPPLIDRDERLPALLPEFSLRWPALRDAPWFAAIGDGAAANVGAGCTGPDRVALTIGTSGAMRVVRRDARISVPDDTWCYLLDRSRQIYGGALSNGGNLVAWLAELLREDDIAGLSAGAAALAPDGHGLTILPFLAGERSPSWNDDLTGSIQGLTLHTDRAAIFRASLEAIAYRFGALYASLAGVVDAEHAILANGGAILRSPLWLQIVADTLNHPLVALDATVEASARGAAICALEAIGAIDDLTLPIEVARTYQPDPRAHAIYAIAQRRQRRLEIVIDRFIERTEGKEIP